MEVLTGLLLAALGCGCIILITKAVTLHMTKTRLMHDTLPFTVYAEITSADEAEYTVRCILERIRWLDLYGMCRVVCLNPSEDVEIDEIICKLAEKYPFVEIGAFQNRKHVL